jgi:PhnB protein
MSFDVFLNFDGDCRDALEFYGAVFRVEPDDRLMTYGGLPEANPADAERILYASLPIFGVNVMFSDCPSGSDYVKGNNVALTLGSADEAELTRLYEALRDGGAVHMALAPTFFSELYAMLEDRFGIIWQLSKTPI